MQILKNAELFYNKLIETKIIYILIGVVILISYYLLYIFRDVDNTVLMSWNLVFYYGDINIYKLLLILSVVIFISFIISRVNIFNKYNEEKYHILLLFISGMIIGSLFWNIPEINPDAARYFTEAKYLEEYGILKYFNDWGDELFVYVDFPSIPLFYGIIFRYLGENREYIQLLNTILFSLTPVLIYKISKRLWKEEIGLYSGFLMLSFPYLLSQVPLMLVDIPLMFLTILSTLLILKVFDNKYYSILTPLTVFLTVYAKMTSFLMIIPAIFILITNYKSVIRNSFRWIFTIFFSILLVIIFFLWKMDLIINQIRYLVMPHPEIILFYESPINYLFQLGPMVILLAIFSCIAAYKKNDKNFIILIPWIFISFLLLHARMRYMVPIFPFIAVMASLSISTISNINIKKFIVSSLVLTSIVFTIYSYIPFEEGFTDVNVKKAAEFTNTINLSEIHLLLDFSENHSYDPKPFVPLFDLYSHKKIIYSDDLKFYPIKDYSNSWTALYELPSFYYVDKSLNSSKNDQIIVIISDKKQSNSIHSRYLENYILIKEFNRTTCSVFIPSSVKVYIPINYFDHSTP